MKVRHNGEWKDATPLVRHSGSWKSSRVSVRNDGEWKDVGSLVIDISEDMQNLKLSDFSDKQDQDFEINVHENVVISSSTVNAPAVDIDIGRKVLLVNNGTIVGAGGDGGNGTRWSGGTGKSGGIGLSVNTATSIENKCIIAGGGGGGGGGAGYGEPGTGGQADSNGSNGKRGGLTTGGAGGAGGSWSGGSGGAGGKGGGIGQFGQFGNKATGNGGSSGSGGSGGSPGLAVCGDEHITWIEQGDIRPPMVGDKVIITVEKDGFDRRYLPHKGDLKPVSVKGLSGNITRIWESVNNKRTDFSLDDDNYDLSVYVYSTHGRASFYLRYGDVAFMSDLPLGLSKHNGEDIELTIVVVDESD